MSNGSNTTSPPRRCAGLLKACVLLAVSFKLFSSLAASSPVLALLAAVMVVGCLLYLGFVIFSIVLQ